MTSDDSQYHATDMEVITPYDESTEINDFEKKSMVIDDSKFECIAIEIFDDESLTTDESKDQSMVVEVVKWEPPI